MPASHASEIHLFSYGTLQLEAVQFATFGRRLEGRDDTMPGWRSEHLEITDPDVLATSGERFHPVVVPSENADDEVEGKVFVITPEELSHADAYEVSDYERVEVGLKSGLRAWVYVQA